MFFLKTWGHVQSLWNIKISQHELVGIQILEDSVSWVRITVSLVSSKRLCGLWCSSVLCWVFSKCFFVSEIVLKMLFCVSLAQYCKVGYFCDFCLPSYENFNCWIKISCRFVSLLSPLKVLSLQTWGWWKERQVRALNPVFDITFLFPSPKEYPELSPNCKHVQLKKRK